MARNPLKAYREDRHLSQQQVADELGVSRQMVSFLENGEREFTADMALLIEAKLGIDRATILPKLFKREAAWRYFAGHVAKQDSVLASHWPLCPTIVRATQSELIAKHWRAQFGSYLETSWVVEQPASSRTIR